MAIRAEGIIGGAVLVGIIALAVSSMRSPAATQPREVDTEFEALRRRVSGAYRVENVEVSCANGELDPAEFAPRQVFLRATRAGEGLLVNLDPCEGQECTARIYRENVSFATAAFAPSPVRTPTLEGVRTHSLAHLRTRKSDAVDLFVRNGVFRRNEVQLGGLRSDGPVPESIACYRYVANEQLEPQGADTLRWTRELLYEPVECSPYATQLRDAGVPACLVRMTATLRIQARVPELPRP